MPKEAKRRALAERYFPGVPIRSVEAMPADGLCNDIFIVNNEIVLRIAKKGHTKTRLDQECRVMELVRRMTDIPAPDMKLLGHGVAYYPYIAGVPLFRHRLQHMDEQKQDALMRKLGEYMHQLHQVPLAAVKEHGVSVSPASTEDYREMVASLRAGYEKIKRELYPRMRTYARACVDAAFKGLENGEAWFRYTPCLIHGDLGLEHILLDGNYEHIAG
ncbi:MAG: phosphotransferase, partial [Oscillospiraceae bacterium]|nr:phosphotransferase [Oscillospiraceae bacterium]